MLKQKASPVSITSKQPWTFWLLKLIGCSGDEQSTANFLGKLDKDFSTKIISEEKYTILLRLIQMFFGPDYIDTPTIEKAYLMLEKEEYELDVIKAFDYYDQVATNHQQITQRQLEGIMNFIETRLKNDAALSYFYGVWCQKEAERGQFASAIAEILNLVKILENLANNDHDFIPRLGLISIMLSQVYNYNKQPQLAQEIEKKYYEAINAYNISQGQHTTSL